MAEMMDYLRSLKRYILFTALIFFVSGVSGYLYGAANPSIGESQYLFSWDDLLENDSMQFQRFLSKDLNMSWVKGSRIEVRGSRQG